MSDEPPKAEAPSTWVPLPVLPHNGKAPSAGAPPDTLYELFRVDPQASADELAEAYRSLRDAYHPRHNTTDPLAGEIVRYLDGAYAVLIDPERRRLYDESLARTMGNGFSANGSGHASALAEMGHVISGPQRRSLRGEVTPEPGAPSVDMSPDTAVVERPRRRRGAYADRDLTTGSVAKNLWFLAWPQMVSGSLQTLDTIWDLLLAGRGFGTRAIAGIGAAQSWSQLFSTARQGLDTSTRAMVSRAVGAGDLALANHVALQAFTLSGSISLLAAAFGIVFTEFLLRLLGLSEGVIAQGANYLRWQFVASGAMAFMFMSGSVLQASGDTLTPMKAQVVSRILDIALAPFLMFGWWLFPEIGLAGAAMANAIAQLVGIGMNFRALFSGTSRLHLSFRGYHTDLPLLWRMVRIGAPSSVTSMERSLAQLILVGLVTPFGDVALASYSLVSRVQMITNLGSQGVGQASGIMVGQNLGAKKPERAKSAVLWAIAYVSAVKVVVVGLMLAFPVLFLSIFSRDAELINTATIWLYIQGVGFFLTGAALVFQQSLNTAGDTMVPMVVTLVSVWGVQQPVAIMLSGVAVDWTIFGWSVPVPAIANLGQYGIAWAVVIGIGVRLFIYVPYFTWGPWTKKEVLGGGQQRGVGAGRVH